MRPIQRSVTAAVLAVTALSASSCTDPNASDPATPRPDEILTVSLSPKLDTLNVGASRQLTTRVYNALNQPREHAVAWSSTNPTIATVTGDGLVTAVAAGQADIIASAGGKPDSATIVVVRAATRLSITPGAMSVMAGDTLILTASVQGDVGAAATDARVQWTTSNSTVAVVSMDGVVSAVDSGDAVITAQLLGTTATAALQVTKTSVATVTVAPANASIYPGETQRLVATLLDASGRPTTASSLKWSSSDQGIATVSSDGLVTGVAKGTAVISAQAQGKRATATVNVLGVPVATVTVSLAANTLAVGQTTQATATLKDAAGTTLTGRVIAWQSSNPALATVTASGIVTAIANGSVTISAISEAKVGNASLTISAPVPTSIDIVPTTVTMLKGQSVQLGAAVRDAKGVVIPNQAVSWSSGSTAIAPVTSAGMLSGVTVGTTTITASADGLTTSAPVSVTSVPAASLSISPTTASVVVGNTAQLTATVRDSTGAVLADRAVNWSSSAAAVATVSSTGLVAGVAAGSATISALVDGLSSTVAVTVTTPPPAPVASVSVSLVDPTLNIGQTTQATATLVDAAGNVLTGRTIIWSSASPEVATVSASGLVTAVAAGSASIVATSEGNTSAATVTVAAPPPAPVATVSLAAASTSLLIGQTTQLTVTLKDASGNVLTGRTIGLTSSNTSLATVSPTGVVTAVGVGTPTITATSEGMSGSIGFTITAPVAPVAVVIVTAPTLSATVGQTVQMTSTLKDAAGNVLTGRSVAWSSSSPSVASVSSTGLVTALNAGSTNIVATSEGKSGSAALSVTAPTPPPPPSSCSLVRDLSPRPTSAFAKPGYLQSVREPDFGTTVTRISGDPGTPIPVVGGTWGQVTAQNYSKDPAWSADGALIVLKYTSGATAGHLYLDGNTYQPLFVRPAPGVEYRWHPTIPDLMVVWTSAGGINHWNPRTKVTTTKFSVSGYSNASGGPTEGNVSYDGRYAVVQATRTSDGHSVAYAVDIDNGTKFPDIDLTAGGVTNLDWVSISALGGYVAAQGTINGSLANMKVWTKGGTVVQTWTDFRMGHLDMGVDQAGNEVLYTAPANGINGKRWITRRFSDGAITVLSPPISYNFHTSTRNNLRRGWGYSVTNDYTGSVLDGEMYALKFDGSGTIERYGRTRNNDIDYQSEPHAVPSPDGKRIMFASNWGAASGRPVQTYVIDFRGCQ